MYTIKVDGQEVYSPALSVEPYRLYAPSLHLEMNAAGSLAFTLPPNHAAYDSIQKMKSIITMEWDGVEIFRGRALEEKKDAYNQKEVYCEGDLSFLLDSVQRPFEFNGTAEAYIRQAIDSHNEQVEDWKQFTMGDFSALTDDKEKELESEGYSDTLSAIRAVLGEYDGFLRTRYENGVNYLDFVASNAKNGQAIEFGVNLIDLDSNTTAEEFCTVLLPIGGMLENGDTVTIASVNDGKDTIENAEGIAQYGRIVKAYNFDDVTDPEELLELAQEKLDSMALGQSLTLKAVDMHLLDPSKGIILPGTPVQIHTLPHGVDREEICISVDLEPESLEKTVYTFGEQPKTQSGASALIANKIRTNTVILKEQWKHYTETDYKVAIQAGMLDSHDEYLAQARLDIDGINGRIGLLAEKEDINRLTGEMVELETMVTISADGLRQSIQESDRTISELQATVDGLDHWITDADGNVAELTNTVRGMQSVVTSVDGRVSTLTNTADGLTNTLSSQGQVLSSFRTRIDEISSTVQDTNGDIGTLVTTSNSVTAKVSNVDGRVSQLAVTADGLTFALSQQGQELTSIKALIDEIGLTVQDTNGALGQLTVQSDRISGKLTDANGKITALMELTDERFTTMLGDIETLEGDVGTIKGSTLWQDRNKIVAAVGEIETMEGDIGTIKGSALWQDRNKIVSAVGKVTTLENNIKTVTGSTLWQDRNKIVAAVGEIETLESDISTLENDISTIKGTALWQDRNNIVAAVGEIETLDGRISTITGSTLWQNRNNITGVVGNMTVDSAGNVVIKEGSGLKVYKNGASYGVYDENNLTAGLLVQKLNGSTTARIKADRINLDGYVTMEDFEAVSGWADNFAGNIVSANSIGTGSIDADEIFFGDMNGSRASINSLSINGTAISMKSQYVLTNQPIVSITKDVKQVMLADGTTATINYVTGVNVTINGQTLRFLGNSSE